MHTGSIREPLLAWLRSSSGRRVYEGIGTVLALPGVVYLLALPLLGAMAMNRPGSILLDPNPYANWNLLAYAQFFLYGFVIATHTRVRRAVERSRRVALGVGLLTAAGLVATLAGAIPVPEESRMLVAGVLFVLNGWLWVLAALGFASRQLTTATPLLREANEAVLPFYVLHQSVLIVIGSLVVSWPLPDLLKFLLIAGSSFVLIVLTYAYLIRRVNLLHGLLLVNVEGHGHLREEGGNARPQLARNPELVSPLRHRLLVHRGARRSAGMGLLR